ncbi:MULTISPECIES: hypothetical protein [unclassified Streptomyces]|uniref:hypothetical protein n=1 Tax=unclassified Streptomyces TaxID=2593676 RepID=UPI0037984EC4
MSTLTRPDADTATAVPVTLRGPARVLLRVHRRSLWSAGAFLAAMAAVLVAAALRADHLVADFANSGCTQDGSVRSCYQPARDYADSMLELSRIPDYASLVLVVLPAVVGAFVAGPLIAREWENGTFRLSWTQSVSPVQWLTARLAAPAVPVVAGTVAPAAVLAWARPRAGAEYPVAWHEWFTFTVSGTVPVANALFALALGTLVGLLLRRTVPAMALTVLAYGAVTATLHATRAGLWPSRTDVHEVLRSRGRPEDAWTVDLGFLTDTGERLPAETCLSSAAPRECLTGLGADRQFTEYHPASHYWPLQLVETGILLALAALAVFAAFRTLRRLHG